MVLRSASLRQDILSPRRERLLNESPAPTHPERAPLPFFNRYDLKAHSSVFRESR
jgi:hypothetical protein